MKYLKGLLFYLVVLVLDHHFQEDEMSSKRFEMPRWMAVAIYIFGLYVLASLIGCASIPKGISFSQRAERQIAFLFTLSERAQMEVVGCMQGTMTDNGDVHIRKIVLPVHNLSNSVEVNYDRCGLNDLGPFHTHILPGLKVCEMSEVDLRALLNNPHPISVVMCRLNDNPKADFIVYYRKNAMKAVADGTLSRPP